MYAWWYVVFGLLGLIVVSAIGWIVGYNKDTFFNRGFDWGIVWVVSEVICIASIIAEVIIFLGTLLSSCCAKEEVGKFKYQSAYVQEAISRGTELENIAITQTIIEQNEWLAKAKASIEIYGVWSSYYYTDAADLEPIVIVR